MKAESPERVAAAVERPDEDLTRDRDRSSGSWPDEIRLHAPWTYEAPTVDALREPPQRDDQDDRILTGDARPASSRTG